jgi:multiple sugar transport system substrate-binding protein
MFELRRWRDPATRRPRIGAALAAVAASVAFAGCSSSGKGPVTLNWYVFPEPSGSFANAASACSAGSGGR